MTNSTKQTYPLLQTLDLLEISFDDSIATVMLNRPAKRNAINDALVTQIHSFFVNLPTQIKAVVIAGSGKHFCAGLDLSEVSESTVSQGILHSQMWHRAFDAIQFGSVPVVSALHGAVVGGGLELASATHIRVAEDSTFYGLPEGQRGLFVGGGGSARIPRLIGFSKMTDMMLTGRVLDADEGQQAGLSHYRVPDGQGLSHAQGLAKKIAQNAPLSNFAVMHALPKIADLPYQDGLFLESLMAAIAQGDEAAKNRIQDFLQGRAQKVAKN